jgi:hypothetical protein
LTVNFIVSYAVVWHASDLKWSEYASSVWVAPRQAVGRTDLDL